MITDGSGIYDGYAVDRPTARLLVHRLQMLRPKVAVEFGSGVSTNLLALYCDQLYSYDHDPRFAHPAATIVPVTTGGYRVDLPDDIEFALIDGPPSHRIGRGQTFHQLYPHLAENFEVWLDDAHRDHEAKCLREWIREYPVTIQYKLPYGKGLAIIRRKRDDAN